MEGLIKILLLTSIAIILLLIWLIGEVAHLSSIFKRKTNIVMADLTKLQADVANETTLDQSVITLLTNLAAEIKAAGTDQAALDAITTQMEQNASALATAVAANTPAQG